MPRLPNYVVLKSKYNGKYLQYLDEEGPLYGFLQCTGEDVTSKYAKFRVELAESDQHLVTIKCCFNKKYWGRSSDDSHWIRSVTDKPEEDPTKWSCTLLEPSLVDDVHDFRFKHVNLGNYAVLASHGSQLTSECLYAESSKPNEELRDVFTVIDWESLVILPKYVAFKGDNGKYLSAIDDGNYLQFVAADNKDPTVVQQVFSTPDGSTFRFKSLHLDKFWRCDPEGDWIVADSDDTSNNVDKDTLFSPVQIEDDVIALKSLGNNNFCKRYTNITITDCLSAHDPTISKWATLQVSEPIVDLKSIRNQVASGLSLK